MSENALLVAWQETRRRRGQEPAVAASNGATLRSFDDIEAEAGTVAHLFTGLSPHAVVAVQIGNSASWPALLIALFRATLVPLPLGRHMESAEMQLAMETCGAAALVTDEAGALRVKRSAAISASAWNDPIPHFLKLTSGTTSAPRAVRFRAQQLLADCENICLTMGITDRDRNFGVIPFSHSYGFSNLITPLIARGVTLVASEDRTPRAILNDLAASGATVFPGMPVFFQKLIELENAPSLPALRLCISAGAPLARHVAASFQERFGLAIHLFYGASECGGIGYDDSADAVREEGFAGRPMRGVKIERTPGGEPGPIIVRSGAVGDGYYPQPDEKTLGAGRFVPSDLIRWAGDEMFIVGRVSDVINVAGRKLNPLELEQRLLQCPGVKQAVVFGIPSALRGEEPIACVMAESGTHAASILRFCQAELSSWQLPRDIWLVDEIPVNERGKVSRRLLAERYAARPTAK
jgi:long-chain acyl-CoA synthetase